jgi:hypothetical protein
MLAQMTKGEEEGSTEHGFTVSVIQFGVEIVEGEVPVEVEYDKQDCRQAERNPEQVKRKVEAVVEPAPQRDFEVFGFHAGCF